jgi:hypothetical protein
MWSSKHQFGKNLTTTDRPMATSFNEGPCCFQTGFNSVVHARAVPAQSMVFLKVSPMAFPKALL